MRTLTEVALALNAANAPDPAQAGGRRLPALILMTDQHRLKDPAAAIRRLPPGSAVIFRDYHHADRPALGAELRTAARAAQCLFLVAGDAVLARALAADGLHLPEQMASAPSPLPGAEHWPLITAAAHSGAALRQAAAKGAHAALLSPVFATGSHPDAESLGAGQFAALVRQAPLPVYALGGISDRNAAQLRGTGAIGLATISGLAL